MATTIEERAKVAFPHIEGMLGEKYTYDTFQMRAAYSLGAQEQDRIARQEERERCIKAAQDAHCGICGDIDCILVDKSDNERRMKCNQLRCIRKAIEEGGEG